MPIKTCIFDAYGTLFDVTAAARKAASEPGNEKLKDIWQDLARDWRDKQIAYSWFRAVTGEHTDFWQVTKDSLDYAMEAHGLHGEYRLNERLLALYWKLSAYPEVPRVLEDLRSLGFQTGILSNGTPGMLDGAVTSAGINDSLDVILSVESVGIFKPAHAAYELVTEHFACEPREVLFVSSNGWDASAARGFGFNSAWVNRSGAPVDRLVHFPDHVVPDLVSIPPLAKAAP